MKKTVCVIVFTTILAGLLMSCSVVSYEPASPAIKDVTIISNAVKYMRNENIPSNDQKTLTACLAKNEGEGMQFVLNFDQDASNVSLSMTDFINEKGEILAAEAYRQYYISVEKNAGYANHGYYPDAMIPLKYDDLNSVDIKAGENQGYWITVTSTEEQTAGIYTGEVTLTHDGGIIKIPVEIEVWDFALPVERSFETAYAIWNNAYNLMQKNNALNGQSYYDVWEQYYWFFQEYRITGTHLPIPFNNVDQYANDILRFASDPRVTSYNISALGNYTIENGVAVPTSATKALLDRMRADGTLEKAYIYMFDEIGDGTASQKETLAAINSYAPDLRVMTTSSPREPLADYIDLFCGIWSSETTAFERYVRDWQQRGYEVWWYGCTAPRAPYPTFHVQDRLMSSRLVRWMQKDWNITGDLFWYCTMVDSKYLPEQEIYVSRDQWTDPQAFPPAGDGYLIYIGTENDGIINHNTPVPTIRLESIRDGNEDNEYLCLMQNKIQQRLDEWDIDNVTADQIMDSYYAPLYNTMGDYNHSPEYMLQVRKQLAHDIMNDSSIVAVLAYMDDESTNKREVRVYAEPNADVVIAGNKAAETNFGKYSTYSSIFLTANENLKHITISINGEQYSRYLKRIEDYEYIEIGCESVDSNVKALGLPLDYKKVRAQYEENMFAPKNIKNLGSLDDQLSQSNNVIDYEKVIINTDIQTTYKIRDCIKTDFNNNIPLVVTNAEISGDPDSVLKKRLTLYAPHGASVKVEKNSAELVKQASGYDVFTYDIEISGTGRYIYEVEVSVAGKTEVYKKVILQQVEKGALLVDLTNQNTIDAIAKISTNKYGTGLNIGNSALQAEFSGKLSRITIKPDSFTLGNNFDGYTAIRFEVKNTGPNKAIGLSLSVAAGSSDVVCGSSGSILPGETKVVIANFPKDYLDSNSLQNIQSLKISQTERASENEYYEISNIMVVSVDNNVN